MSEGQSYAEANEKHYYWEWILAVGAALFTTLACFLIWGLQSTAALTTSTGAPIVATPAFVPTALPTAVPTPAPAVAPTVAAAVAAVAPILQSTREVIVAGPYTLQGTGTAGSIVEVLVNDESAGTATVGADGRWSLDTVLAAGTAAVVARMVDTAGAVMAEADAVSLSVSAAAEAPTFNVPPGALVGGPAVLSGTGTPGSRVRISVDDTVVGSAIVGADGTWEVDTILAPGTQTVVVEALDAGAQVVAASDPAPITVEGGLGVTLVTPEEGEALQPGVNTISGTGTAGTDLEVLDGDLVVGETTVGADGTWTTQVTLEDGSASISVREAGTEDILVRPVRVAVGTAAALPAGCGDEVQVDCPAWVTRAGGLTLRMRSEAAITPDNIVARLPIGTGMTVEEGPEDAEGFTWWRVTTRGGSEGWVAGENLVSQPD